MAVNHVPRAVALWLVLLAAMTANGAFRMLVLEPRLGELRAHQLSSLLGVGLVFLVAWWFVRGLPEPHAALLLGTGALWLALSVAFEFLFGRYVGGASWAELLADYDVVEGRLWPLVLLAVLLSPWASSLAGGRGKARAVV
jgi:hypothetical protein